MFGEKVIELIKEAERNHETIDQYNVRRASLIIKLNIINLIKIPCT